MHTDPSPLDPGHDHDRFAPGSTNEDAVGIHEIPPLRRMLVLGQEAALRSHVPGNLKNRDTLLQAVYEVAQSSVCVHLHQRRAKKVHLLAWPFLIHVGEHTRRVASTPNLGPHDGLFESRIRSLWRRALNGQQDVQFAPLRSAIHGHAAYRMSPCAISDLVTRIAAGAFSATNRIPPGFSKPTGPDAYEVSAPGLIPMMLLACAFTDFERPTPSLVSDPESLRFAGELVGAAMSSPGQRVERVTSLAPRPYFDALSHLLEAETLGMAHWEVPTAGRHGLQHVVDWTHLSHYERVSTYCPFEEAKPVINRLTFDPFWMCNSVMRRTQAALEKLQTDLLNQSWYADVARQRAMRSLS